VGGRPLLSFVVRPPPPTATEVKGGGRARGGWGLGSPVSPRRRMTRGLFFTIFRF
jgi:hypothetical protein